MDIFWKAYNLLLVIFGFAIVTMPSIVTLTVINKYGLRLGLAAGILSATVIIGAALLSFYLSQAEFTKALQKVYVLISLENEIKQFHTFFGTAPYRVAIDQYDEVKFAHMRDLVIKSLDRMASGLVGLDEQRRVMLEMITSTKDEEEQEYYRKLLTEYFKEHSAAYKEYVYAIALAAKYNVRYADFYQYLIPGSRFYSEESVTNLVETAQKQIDALKEGNPDEPWPDLIEDSNSEN
jgi:hypothetical protein